MIASQTPKTALVTGITGQDGSYLTEFLPARGYRVHGIVRRASTFDTERIDHLHIDPHEPESRLFLHYGDLSDGNGLAQILNEVRPDEVYNLGAQSHVQVSFLNPRVYRRRRCPGNPAPAGSGTASRLSRALLRLPPVR